MNNELLSFFVLFVLFLEVSRSQQKLSPKKKREREKEKKKKSAAKAMF